MSSTKTRFVIALVALLAIAEPRSARAADDKTVQQSPPAATNRR